MKAAFPFILLLFSCTKTAQSVTEDKLFTVNASITYFSDTVLISNEAWECPGTFKWNSDTIVTYYRHQKPVAGKLPVVLDTTAYGKLTIRKYYIYTWVGE